MPADRVAELTSVQKRMRISDIMTAVGEPVRQPSPPPATSTAPLLSLPSEVGPTKRTPWFGGYCLVTDRWAWLSLVNFCSLCLAIPWIAGFWPVRAPSGPPWTFS